MLNIFSFKGGTSRKVYWFTLLGLFLYVALFVNVFKNDSIVILLVILIVPFFAVQAKRCNDVGWSKWWMLCHLIPYVNFLWLIILGIKGSKYTPSESYKNSKNNDKYGKTKSDKSTHNNGEEEREKDHEYKKTVKSRIVACPECNQRLKITIPLPSEVVRCRACSSRFKIKIDKEGSIYITHEERKKEYNQDPESDEGPITIKDSFSILSLSENATKNEIKKAYRIKMKDYHPDRVEHLGDKLKEVAAKEARNINIAYNLLKEQGYA